MAIGVIVQARMGSTRLPGKVLKEVLGKPLLEFLIDRVKRAKMVDQIIIATTNSKKDNKIEKFALLNNLFIFRGSEDDVLDRYFRCATKYKLNTIVRITADCPLIDSNIIDDVINFYKNGHFDYVTNGINSTFPDGMDVEVFSFNALKRAWREAKLSSERENVTAYIWKNTAIFNIGIYRGKVNNSYLRLTVDEMEDFTLVKKLISDLYPKKQNFSLNDIILHLKKNPDLVKINSRIGRNEGYFKSISKDKIHVGKLKGKRLYLMELKLGNVTSEYCRWLNDKEVNKYLETKRSTINTLKEYVSQKINDPSVIFLGIFDKHNNKHIGNIKLEGVGLKSKTAELGMMIGNKNYWGKGFAPEAIELLAKYVFVNLGLKSIILGVYNANKEAIRAYEKAGFVIIKSKGRSGVWMKLSRPQ